MRLSSFVLALLPMTYARPLAPRQASQSTAPQLLSTIKELTTNVKDLTTAVNNYEGSFLSLLPQAFAVVVANTKVDASTNKATEIITSQNPGYTADESKEIVQTLASQIGPIQASLDALKAKYPAFKKTFISPVVLLALQKLQTDTDGLLTALTAKVTPDNAGLLGLGKSILDKAFADAVAVYSA